MSQLSLTKFVFVLSSVSPLLNAVLEFASLKLKKDWNYMDMETRILVIACVFVSLESWGKLNGSRWNVHLI